MAWSHVYDTALPAGSNAPNVLDDQIRRTKAAIQERLALDHYFPLTGTEVSDTSAGKHKKVTYQTVLGAKPTLLAGESATYTKTVSALAQLFFENPDGTEFQLTNLSGLNVLIANIQALLTNDTYWTAINEAADGTVNLIKAGKNEADDTEVAILPDKTRLASNATPLEDTAIPNKKFVTDQIATRAVGELTALDTDTAGLVKDTVYLAGSDGFINATLGSAGTITLLSSVANPPTTVVDRSGTNFGFANVGGLIKSGNYVKITADAALTDFNWTPFGTGGLAK